MPMTFMVRQIESMPTIKSARPRGRPDLIPDDAIDTAIRMREEGAFWRDISAAVGASSAGIRKAVERRLGEGN